MIDGKNIKRFVRKTLGCTCPKEVFQHIECKTDVGVNDNIILSYEINIGNKLLIFVFHADDIDPLGPVISQLVGAGTRQRDERGFIRFRLVLVCKEPDSIADQASTIFNSIGADDERVHLHVIGQDEFDRMG